MIERVLYLLTEFAKSHRLYVDKHLAQLDRIEENQEKIMATLNDALDAIKAVGVTATNVETQVSALAGMAVPADFQPVIDALAPVGVALTAASDAATAAGAPVPAVVEPAPVVEGDVIQ